MIETCDWICELYPAKYLVMYNVRRRRLFMIFPLFKFQTMLEGKPIVPIVVRPKFNPSPSHQMDHDLCISLF